MFYVYTLDRGVPVYVGYTADLTAAYDFHRQAGHTGTEFRVLSCWPIEAEAKAEAQGLLDALAYRHRTTAYNGRRVECLPPAEKRYCVYALYNGESRCKVGISADPRDALTRARAQGREVTAMQVLATFAASDLDLAKIVARAIQEGRLRRATWERPARGGTSADGREDASARTVLF